ncbi:MAG: phospho-N-acetylmuramoyl-pentapeptide-transferase [Clostridia bacterium]|nr:phospho-N-acetylmuramoyl-pentapeptide-transferase [Clostridia bacterium]
MKDFYIVFAVATVAVFLLTVLAEHVMIPILRSHKMGQRILEIGPRWHKSKEGTPIMGGIGFILAAMIVMAIFFVVQGIRGSAAAFVPLAMTLAFAVGNGAVGFADDYCKLIKKQNEGLTRLQKLVLQSVLAVAYVAVMAHMGYLTTVVYLPFTDVAWDMGWVFYPVAVVALLGVVNGANFTDGIDGLASTVSLVIGVFFAVLAFTLANESLGMSAAILIGATLGFLIYNFHPARVFMGDTGSLFLGALIIGAAFSCGIGVSGLIVCILFILELLSSGLQILYYKLTHGKRLFKMAPIHHHFEKCGWGEIKIVIIFSLFEAALCLLAYFAL